MHSNSFNIALLPPPSAVNRAIRLSRKLQKEGGLFVLNKTAYSSHVTLYMTELPLKNLKDVVRELKLIASQTNKVRLVATSYKHSDRYVDISYHRSPDLNQLQKLVIDKINPLREGLIREKDTKRLKSLNKQQRKAVKKYGYRSIGRNFRPHLTLTKLEIANPKILKKLPTNPQSFTSSELAIFYLGEYGSCKRLVARFKLK